LTGSPGPAGKQSDSKQYPPPDTARQRLRPFHCLLSIRGLPLPPAAAAGVIFSRPEIRLSRNKEASFTGARSYAVS